MMLEVLPKQRLLWLTGLVTALMFVIFVALAFLDNTAILGLNRWIKPMKFALSIATFVWTLAFYLYYLPNRERAARIIARGVAVLMLGEMALITLQAARGVPSHFNNATPFDGLVFASMGLMILASSGLVGYLLFLYFTAAPVASPAMVWALRLGLILFLLASGVGAFMSVILRHSVGVADGGPGLPLVNWSTQGGDLRIAHFIGLHALQAVPLFAVVAEKLRARVAPSVIWGFAGAYGLLFSLIFLQALRGIPLWRGF